MHEALFQFFKTKVFTMSYGMSVEVFGRSIYLNEYFSLIASYVGLTIIFVLCCLFVWKIIKLVGNLIR